jgi:hypothetical protein
MATTVLEERAETVAIAWEPLVMLWLAQGVRVAWANTVATAVLEETPRQAVNITLTVVQVEWAGLV